MTDTALSLLFPVFPDYTLEHLANLSIGERDALIFKLHQKTFGKILSGFAKCPKCEEHLEFQMSTSDFLDNHAQNTNRSFKYKNIELFFRPVTGRDLLETQCLDDLNDARLALIDRTVTGVFQNGESITITDLPNEALQILSENLSQSDPLADIMLDLNCPACGETWECLLDIVSFLFHEIAAEAKRLLNEVHILAEAYGWKEKEILALSPGRRLFYMEVAGS